MALELVAGDTDLVIDYLRGADPGAAAVRTWLREGRLRLTAVTAYELRVGADFLDRSDDFALLLAGRALPLDVEAALTAGAVAVNLRARGLPIGVADCLQAGVCLRFDIALATRNVHHFARIEGLRLAELPA